MSMLFLLIAFSLAIAVTFLGLFVWACRSGQYRDTDTPSLRILTEDDMTESKTARGLHDKR